MSHLHPQGSFDLGDHPLPTGKEEVWRFTPLDRLSSVLQGAVGGSPDQGSHKSASDGVKVAFDAPGGGASDTGSPDWAPDGVEVEFDAPGGGSPDPGPPDWAPDGVKVVFDAPGDLVAGPLAIGQAPRGTVLVPTDRVAALASLGAPRAHFLRVPAGRVLDRPIR
ncbi:MAG: hypothetical protein LBS56_04840, partial [Propionibacteriaceae bacterium]|nr:hypothetical protein [Propionibacteriaceae bacterium]